MRIVDTIISREDGNSVWANVVFVGDRGESVSVRLPCPVPYGGQIGRGRIIDQATKLLAGLLSADESAPPTVRMGRFGVPETVALSQDMSSGED